MYIHYFHFNKVWLYWEDNSPNKKAWRPYLWNGENILSESDNKTKKEVKNILKALYPDKILIHTIAYHEGPRHIKVSRKSRF